MQWVNNYYPETVLTNYAKVMRVTFFRSFGFFVHHTSNLHRCLHLAPLATEYPFIAQIPSLGIILLLICKSCPPLVVTGAAIVLYLGNVEMFLCR